MVLVPPAKIVKQKAFILLPVLMAAVLLAWLFLEVSKNYELSSFIVLHNKMQRRALVIAQKALSYAGAHQLASCFVGNVNWHEDKFWEKLSASCQTSEGGKFVIESYQEQDSEENQGELFYRITSFGKVKGEKVILQTTLRPQSGGRMSQCRLI